MKDANLPLVPHAWRCVFLSSLLSLLAVVLLHVLPQPATVWVVPGLFLGGWVMAVRFLLFDSWGRWLWVVFLVLAFFSATFLGEGWVPFGGFMTLVFLSIRRYRTWRHISAQRRAWGFAMGLLVLGASLSGWGVFFSMEKTGNVEQWIRAGHWAYLSVIGFWIYSLFHLVMNMRLHFMRLRAKLGVSAFLIGFVPITLIIILALAALWFGLGGARAQRGLSTLDSWRVMTEQGYSFSGAVFDTSFIWPGADIPAPLTSLKDLQEPEVFEIQPPADISKLIESWEIHRGSIEAEGGTVKPDSTGWFFADKRLWLMHWQGLDGGSPSVQGWALGQEALLHLSRNLHAGIRLSLSDFSSKDGALVIGTGADNSQDIFPGIQYYFRNDENIQDFWDKYFYFGGGILNVAGYSDSGWSNYPLVMQVRVSYQDLLDDFVGNEEDLNIGIVIGFGALAVLFLIIEIFALFFSVRITEGIISAVHSLHRRTKTMAAGDLESLVDIPNEDEFGDLAYGFNEMTSAMKSGQEAALANQRLTQEMDTAREIQERLLPSSDPLSPGFQITGSSIPSREVGGDYFDFLVLDENNIGVAIGDVSGKGMPSALLMANLQASLQGQVIHPSSVSKVVSRVNDLLVRSTDPHMFATFFYGLIDLKSGIFTCTNAGHNPPLVLRNSGEIDLLTKGGLLLGMLEDRVYKQDSIQLELGEVVVLYTDGITEAVGPGVEEDDPEAMFGEQALMEILKSHGHLPAVGIKEAILDAVKFHTAGMRQSDDITLVVIKRQH